MNQDYDVIIMGSGIAGMYTALSLSPKLRVLLLSKKELMICNSALAQGGVAAVTDRNDNFGSHIHDTFVAGGFKNDPVSTRTLVEKGPADVLRLPELGVVFDKNADGSYHRTLEGGHSKRRILHHKDSTGREITEKLIAAVKKLPNVTLLEQTTVCDAKKVSNGFWVKLLQKGAVTVCCAKKLVIASGGIGRVYPFTTNAKIATGDGITLAHQLGAVIKNLHLIQFHPTAFNDRTTRECFLISEAVRGEGAYLLNCEKERFMHRYDARLELAPRDVVSHSIMAEEKRTGSDRFYLDISHQPADFVKNRFPMIYQRVLEAGYDMTKEPIPIYPCQHYLMGGINTDIHGRTNIEGLYACGECAHTGVHGNNRLASNSLLEALVFGRQAAEDINGQPLDDLSVEEYTFPADIGTSPLPKGLRTEIRQIMRAAYFVNPDLSKAKTGLERIGEIKALLETGNYRLDEDYLQAKSLATVAAIILSEVIQGKEVAQ